MPLVVRWISINNGLCFLRLNKPAFKSRSNGIYRQEPVETLKKNTPLIVRPLEGTRPQSTFMPPLSQSRGRPDTVVVVVVVSRIQRIGCQPEKTSLHGGQSRSWSAEQGKKIKIKSPAPPPPLAPLRPLPRAAHSEKIKIQNYATHPHI